MEQPEQPVPDALKWEVDELGSVAHILVDTSVYNKAALFKTAYWYTDRCHLFLSRPDNSEIIRVEVRSKADASKEQLLLLCRTFCNSLIDQQVRQEVIQETGAVRDALLKKAFAEASSHLDPKLLLSHESHVPKRGQSYLDDPLQIGKITGAP